MALKRFSVDWHSFTRKAPPKDTNTFPTGTVIFTGKQGSGKTYGMVAYAWEIHAKYPKAKIWTNVQIDAPWAIRWHTAAQLGEILRTQRNGSDGMLLIIDEAHLFWHRRDGIPLELLASISQQRKQRLRICFSSQIFEELDISLRKQITDVVTCSRLGRTILIESISRGDTLQLDKNTYQWQGIPYKVRIIHLTQEIASSYDTLQEVACCGSYSVAPTR